MAVVSVLAVSGIFVYFGLSPTSSSPPAFSAFELTDGSMAARVRSLEAHRLATSLYMIVFALLGLVGIAANRLLSIWHIKITARKIVRQRIDGFEEIFEEKLLSKIETADRAVKQLQTRVARMSERSHRAQNDLVQTVASGTNKIHEFVDQEVLEMKRIIEPSIAKQVGEEKE
jgi:type II secretory pathway component PulL